MERLESFLAVEQRVRWCGVGVVDITSFKWYNDTLGHAVGDRIIERVAQILSDQIRSEDYLAVERTQSHARSARALRRRRVLFPDSPPARVRAGDRDRRTLQAGGRAHDWSTEDPRLADHPVGVDVGVVCLRLGPVAERRGIARQLAAELIQRADALMYEAKSHHAQRVYAGALAVVDGGLVDLHRVRRPPVPRPRVIALRRRPATGENAKIWVLVEARSGLAVIPLHVFLPSVVGVAQR